ncbi:hypothetical protein [Candidatus Atelocyanobacterium thalassae]|uniref:TPR repeat-containing protein n=2 Tax=Candidatus Atelocyanobacterium thalassae TaxID=713887 RepID=A0A086CIN5_9CHRO|nr:hypothetical protein [Candidatus Atelocyanobacterium thalassa]KFF42049.1 MAG: hypothetical protein ucyna2_00108 [Candidatus Atelocyanobacterium thalassa isolate SIO64986]BDA39863.1 hypothetical protein CPARK_000070300 [cyanobacterium endosymbiont of Braarudosphaera bigelowii]
MTDLSKTDFEEGLERYKQGEKAEDLIVHFKEICNHSPKYAIAWTCLAWLYLLVDKPYQALKAAKKSVKIDSKSPQGRINLALAMLECDEKGVRSHIEAAKQVMSLDQETYQEVLENIEDGLNRKPDWKNLKNIEKWLSLAN